MPGISSVQISLLAERGVVEYDGNYVNEYGEHWTDKKIADEVEDVGFDAEIVEKSEVAHIELRVYGYVYIRGVQLGADAQTGKCRLCRLCYHVPRIFTRSHWCHIPISTFPSSIQPYTDPHITTDNSGHPSNRVSAPHFPPDLYTQQFASIITAKT